MPEKVGGESWCSGASGGFLMNFGGLNFAGVVGRACGDAEAPLGLPIVSAQLPCCNLW